MCAIVDVNIVPELFSSNSLSAGRKFLEWLDSGTGVLVVGGILLEELNNTQAKMWLETAIRSERAFRIDSNKVNARTSVLEMEHSYKSDDPHILALAQLSGARLLYTNDRDLQADFKNKALIDTPRGKVYSTLQDKEFKESHKNLIENKNLCRSK